MSLVRWFDFSQHAADKGVLVAIEGLKNIPFEIKRVYFIANVPSGVARGFHAHKELQQIMICVSGKCRVVLDDGEARESVWLDSPDRGLFIDKMIWHEMHDFSENCVLLVVASDYYEENDYIRDHSQFVNKACE